MVALVKEMQSHPRTNAKVLTSTKDMDRKSWLDWRRKGIGGSDASICLDMTITNPLYRLNKYKSPIGLYLDKTGQLPEEKEESEAAQIGRELEDYVAQKFVQKVKKDLGIEIEVEEYPYLLQHPDHPFMLANIDRLIKGSNIGLECKTASEYFKADWEGENIPASYIVQCQHYMAVTGFQEWWIAVLIGGNKFTYKKIDRDDEFIDMLIQAESVFWTQHVEANRPPAMDDSDATTELLKQFYPNAEEETEIILDEEEDALEWANRLLELKEKSKSLESDIALYENRLKSILQTHAKGRVEDIEVSWVNSHRTLFDHKKFGESHPELYQQFLTVSSSRRFSVKKIKPKKESKSKKSKKVS